MKRQIKSDPNRDFRRACTFHKTVTALLVATALCMVVASGCCWTPSRNSKDPLLANVAQISNKDLINKFRDHGFDLSYILSVQRDKSRTKLFVTGMKQQGYAHYDYVVTADKVAVNNIPPGAIASFDENGNVATWFRDLQRGVHFASGEFVHLGSNGVFTVMKDKDNVEATIQRPSWPVVSSFEVDPAGEYFVFGNERGNVFLGRARSPGSVQRIADELVVYSLFHEKANLYVSGWHTNSSGVSCIVLRETPEGGFVTTKEHYFRGMNSVIDVDESGSRVLLSEESDFMARLYVQDLATGRRRCIGRADKHAYFLKNEIVEK